MESLHDIGLRMRDLYSTDKSSHGFARHYAARWEHLREQPITICEIGTWRGGSLRMWREYFTHPDAKVVGFDHAPEWTPGPGDRITLEVGKQEDVAFQVAFAGRHGPFDLVIDDGGHAPEQHLASLAALWPHIKPGGWYAIEDMHSIYNACWNPHGARTIMDWLALRWQSILVGGSDIIETHVVGGNWDDGLLFLRKRREDEVYRGETP